MDHDDRVEFYKHAHAFADRHNQDMCGFDMLQKRIGTESKYGEIYQANLNNKTIEAAVKLMPINHKHRREIKYYEELNKLVTKNINPHFPIVFFSKTCKQCPFKNRAVEDCYVVMKEFADGDLKSWLKHIHSIDEHLSEICQLMIIIIGLAQKKIIHYDLHWGNLLYHKTPKQNLNKYMYYIIQGHDVYIKMKGYHWIIWDFGLSKNYSSKEPKKNTFTIDLYNISGVAQWSKEDEYTDIIKPVPPKIADLYEMIGDATHDARYNSSETEIDFFMFKFKQNVDAINKNILLIDPKIPPPPSNIINPSKPYTITD